MIISDAHGDVIRSFDGTLLSTRRSGTGAATPLLLCNAVGANDAIWKRALVDVQRERPVIAWDHRGLLGSGPPATDRLDAGAQAEDALAVAAHHGIEEFAIASWSNGSRIALEVATRYPERVKALVMVNGGFGHPFGRLLRHLEVASAFPSLAGVAKHFGAALQGPLRAVTERPELAGLIRQSGLVGATADSALLVELVRGIAACDLKTFFATYEAIAGDSAPELAARVDAPTLLIAGDKDIFTPLSMIVEMHAVMRAARLEVYEKAGHYLPIEYPAKLSDDIRRFLGELAL
ncbi:MAG: alpha/beta hydrolase [Actinobacteria bacterium]|nr:alpha/beta hydrolase [Actinomycetota bacterium]